MFSHRGLTLLELLIAVSLLSAISATAALHYPRLVATWELKAAVRQIVLELSEARTQAIAESRPVRLLFTVPGATYARQRRGDDGVYEDQGPPTALPRRVEVADCTARGAAISFQPRGHAGSFGTLTLRNDEGEQRQIVVDIAGRMRTQ